MYTEDVNGMIDVASRKSIDFTASAQVENKNI
jgi:hypothetical protein